MLSSTIYTVQDVAQNIEQHVEQNNGPNIENNHEQNIVRNDERNARSHVLLRDLLSTSSGIYTAGSFACIRNEIQATTNDQAVPSDSVCIRIFNEYIFLLIDHTVDSHKNQRSVVVQTTKTKQKGGPSSKSNAGLYAFM